MVSFEHLEAAQRRAVEAHDRNYAVTAGAGSGKTTTFTSRYMTLLRETDATPASVAAITFTESGARELRERVREGVRDRLRTTDGESRREWQTYHEALPESYIHTIHGFCARLLREHALRADVPVGFDVIEETAARGYQREVVESFVEAHLDDERLDAVTVVYGRERLEELLGDLLADHHRAREWADAWADRSPAEYLSYVRSEYATVDVDEARRCLDAEGVAAAVADIERVAAAESAGRERITIAQNVAEVAATHEFAPDEMDDIEVHDAVAALCEALTSDGTAYRGGFDVWSYTGHDDWTAANADRYETATDVVAEAMPVEAWATADRLGVDRNAARAYTALAALYRDLHERYQARKRREAVLDFDDLIDGAVTLLSTTPAVRAQVRDSFDYVMLDEVQDTDPRQWRLVRLLASAENDYDGQNVFVVGDEKQSIFRFRGADVAQFRRERERLSAANVDRPPADPDPDRETGGDGSLARNFRSLPAVLDPINDLFEHLFGAVPAEYRDVPTGVTADTSFEPVAQSLAANRTDGADVSTGVTGVFVPEEKAARSRLFDGPNRLSETPETRSILGAETLAAEVAALLDGETERYETVGFEDAVPVEEATAVEPADVAVLLRNRNDLDEYERALSKYEVPYTVASGIGFYDRTEVVALRNLFRVLLDPTADLALFGVLRSPLFGFDDPTVVGCWAALDTSEVGDGALWRALGRTDDEGLAAARASVERWRRLAGIDGGDAVVETWDALLGRIVDETGYLASLAVDERGRQAVANVEKFRDRLREWNEDGVQTLSALVDRIERAAELSAREGDAEVPAEADGVRLLTVHDAKGLEFPVVFVPGLAQSFTLRSGYGDGAAEFEQLADGADGERTPLLGIDGPSVGEAFDRADTVLKRRLTFAREREAVAEEKRILYVAMTRARDHLFLVGVTSADDDGNPVSVEQDDAEDPSSWLDFVGPALFDEETVDAFAADGRATVTGPSGTPVTVRAPRTARPLTTGSETEPPALSEAGDGWEPATEYSVAASYVGSLVADGAPGEVYTDHTGRYVSYAPPDEPAGEEPGAEDDDTTAASTMDESAEPAWLPRNVFGDALHKATELSIDAGDTERLRTLLAQFARGHDVAPDRVSADDVAELRRHRRVAREFLAGLDGTTAAERPVRARLDGGEVYGDIDHLAVTPDTYHIVDFKTNVVDDPDEIPAKASSYNWQLRAYAVGLHQSDPDRDVRATLLFTDADETWATEWAADELDFEAERLDSAIRSSLDAAK